MFFHTVLKCFWSMTTLILLKIVFVGLPTDIIAFTSGFKTKILKYNNIVAFSLAFRAVMKSLLVNIKHIVNDSRKGQLNFCIIMKTILTLPIPGTNFENHCSKKKSQLRNRDFISGRI